MNRFFSVSLAAVVACGLALSTARADESVLAELYGQGVHAYFAGDYFTAHDLLTEAIDQGSRDPRCYFFRGLTYMHLGRSYEAELEFKIGAEMEANSTDRVYPVSDSLQRIQGRQRLQIERIRQQARLVSKVSGSKAQQSRYDELRKAEQNVLRGQPGTPAAPPANMGQRKDPSDPFARGQEEPPVKAPPRAAPVPAVPSAPAVADPAAPSAAPAMPAEADPFGTPAAPAAPAAKPDAQSDPFQDDKPAAKPTDPF
jgi:hypothetical protein